MVNFGPVTAEICWRVWGTPANFNGFRVLAALLQGTVVVGVSQTLQRWTEGATYIRQGSHHVGHWPTFLVCIVFLTNKHDDDDISWQCSFTSCTNRIVAVSEIESGQSGWSAGKTGAGEFSGCLVSDDVDKHIIHCWHWVIRSQQSPLYSNIDNILQMMACDARSDSGVVGHFIRCCIAYAITVSNKRIFI